MKKVLIGCVAALLMMGVAPAQENKSAAKKSESKEESKAPKVVTTPSGLKYQDLVEGTGASPKGGETVVVHYTGWLLSLKKFDSSVGGQPFSFRLGKGEVIKGWDEGVATMKVGGKRKLVIPADLAYGEKANGMIPANATLVFEVELLEIKK
jgi:peptidylprolyl isomerase